MRLGTGVVAGILGTALGFMQPAQISAQAMRDTVRVSRDIVPTRDTAQVALPSVTVQARSPQELAARKMQRAVGHNDPLLERTLFDPDLSSAMPGVSRVPFLLLPLATQIYWDGVPFLGQSVPNFGLVPAFTSDHIEMEQRPASTITPSLDAAMAIRTAVERGGSISLQPFQQSASYGYTNRLVRTGVSGAFGEVPGFLPQETKEKSSLLGRGPLLNASVEVGNAKRSLFSDVYWLRRSTDLSKGFRVEEYRDNLEQGLATVRARTPMFGSRLEVLASQQFARMDTRIRDIGQDTARLLHQDLKYTLFEATLHHGLSRGGAAVYSLDKVNALDAHKSFWGRRLFVDHTQIFPTGALLSADARVDRVGEESHASAHVSLLQTLGRFELEIAWAKLFDPAIAEKLTENIAQFTPNSEIAPQHVRYVSARVAYRQGGHFFNVAIEPRSGSAEQYKPGARINGQSLRFTYQRETPQMFVALSGVHRDFMMFSPSGAQAVPGMSKTEFKLTAGQRSPTHFLGGSFTFRSPTHVPQTGGLNFNTFTTLNNQYILTLLASKEVGQFTTALTVSNALGLVGVNNVIGSYNDLPLLMPVLPSISFTYAFGKH